MPEVVFDQYYKTIYIQNIGMDTFIMNIDKYKEYKAIDISNYDLAKMEDYYGLSFDSLIKLISANFEIKKLILANCKLEYLPQSIYKLNSLKILELSNNSLSNLPVEIIKLDSLKEISLQRCINLDHEIWNIISQISNLEIIDLSDCNLDSLPLTFLSLTNNKNIKGIMLAGNNLSDLPFGFANFKNLSYLNITRNKFKDYPSILSSLNCDILEITALISCDELYSKRSEWTNIKTLICN